MLRVVNWHAHYRVIQMDLDKAGFYAKTRSMAKAEMHDQLMKLFDLAQFAETQGELHGDYNWELVKADAGLPNTAN